MHEHGRPGRSAPGPRPRSSLRPVARARPRPAAGDGGRRRARRASAGRGARGDADLRRHARGRPERAAGRRAPAARGPARASARRSSRARSPAAVDGRFSRVQATVDLLPTDILGATIWHAGTETFEFHPGPVFANVVLVDELNRATPKTQSGLLEAMQELQVTVDGRTHPLERAVHGDRHPEPERRLRRHLPAAARAARPLPRARVARLSDQRRRRSRCCASRPAAAASARAACASCSRAQAQVEEVRASEALLAYIVGVLDATRAHPLSETGASPRAGLQLLGAARARAALQGRDYVAARRRPGARRRRCSRTASSPSPPPPGGAARDRGGRAARRSGAVIRSGALAVASRSARVRGGGARLARAVRRRARR